MIRACLLVLLLAAAVCPGTVRAADTLTDLRFELDTQESLAGQLDVVERMRALLREDSLPEGQINVMIYGLVPKPVFAEEAATSLLREMLATPEIAETTITALANQFSGRAMDVRSSDTVAGMLFAWHQQQGLPDPAISALTRALNKSAPRVRREHAINILAARPLTDSQQQRFLRSVSDLLEPEITATEKYRALEILLAAAKTQELPRAAQSALYRIAMQEPDDGVRLAAWPFVLPRAATASNRFVFGMDLTRQLTNPESGELPSFVDAYRSERERAVALLSDYWEPNYPTQFVDALIQVVAEQGFESSIQKLVELRRIDALSDEQLAAISDIETNDPTVRRIIATIATPNLALGSLVGPMEVIAYSDDAEERAAATQQLLDQHPTGAVPMAVADAAYEVIGHSDAYDAAAVALVVRADEAFAAREAKILRMADGAPQRTTNVVRALQHLHDDADLDFLVRHYADNEAVDESLRATLVSMLYSQVRDGGDVAPDTAASVVGLARSADRYSTVDIATRLLRAAGADVPLSVRLREKDVQWTLLGWIGIATLVVGILSGLALLILVALPGRTTGLDRGERLGGFGVFLLLGTLLVGACGVALLHSIGHNYTPPPNQAAPWYFAAFMLAASLVAAGLYLKRRGQSKPG